MNKCVLKNKINFIVVFYMKFKHIKCIKIK